MTPDRQPTTSTHPLKLTVWQRVSLWVCGLTLTGIGVWSQIAKSQDGAGTVAFVVIGVVVLLLGILGLMPLKFSAGDYTIDFNAVAEETTKEMMGEAIESMPLEARKQLAEQKPSPRALTKKLSEYGVDDFLDRSTRLDAVLGPRKPADTPQRTEAEWLSWITQKAANSASFEEEVTETIAKIVAKELPAAAIARKVSTGRVWLDMVIEHAGTTLGVNIKQQFTLDRSNPVAAFLEAEDWRSPNLTHYMTVSETVTLIEPVRKSDTEWISAGYPDRYHLERILLDFFNSQNV